MTSLRSALPVLTAFGGLLGGCGGAAPAGVTPGADVVLIVVDTLRADGLSCYGNARPTSPVLDALAAEGVRFDECLAPAPNTATSHASLFTGLSPWAHRVANLTSLELGTPGLPDAFETLAERFREAGYRTAAITDGGPVGEAWNLMQGFDSLDAEFEGVTAKVDRALQFLDDERDERPLFLFLHTYQVHQPFAPPEELVERFDPGYDGLLAAAVDEVRAARASGAGKPNGKILLRDLERFTSRDEEHLRALYDAEIAYTDAELGRLLDRLRARDRWERTVVAVTSDHGEEFGEHGRFGHVQLHHETLRVPLILRLPEIEAGLGGAGQVVAERVQLVDLNPTLLEAAGLDVPDLPEAESLLVGLRRGGFADRPAVAVTTEHLYLGRPDHPWQRSVRHGTRALLSTRSGADVDVRAFDLAADPAEREPLTGGGGALATLLAEHLQRQEDLRRALVRGAFRLEADPETLEEMDALGYTGDDE